MASVVFPIVAAHSVSVLLVHVVWATHDRRPHIEPELDASLESMLRAKATELRVGVHAFGAGPDHVHLLLQHAGDVSVAAVVQRLKGASSYAFRRMLPGGWQAGYWAQSVSPDSLDPITAYVLAQRAHHASTARRESWQMEPAARRA